MNNDPVNKEIYGALYNWHVVGTGKICPREWHVPTNPEWKEMVSVLGDIDYAGDKLKEAGIIHWRNNTESAINEFG